MKGWRQDYLNELFVITVQGTFGKHSTAVAQGLIDGEVDTIRWLFDHLPDSLAKTLPQGFTLFIQYVDSYPVEVKKACKALDDTQLFFYWHMPQEWRTLPKSIAGQRSCCTSDDIASVRELAEPVIDAYKAAMLDIIAWPSTLPPDPGLEAIVKNHPGYLYPQDGRGYYQVRKGLLACFGNHIFDGIPLLVLKRYVRSSDGTEFSKSTWKKYSNGDFI